MAVKSRRKDAGLRTQEYGSTNGWADARTVKGNKYPCTLEMGMK